MTLKQDGYMPRVVDDQIDRYLKLFGAIEVGGTKWCGKTWTSLAHSESVTYVDRGSNLEITTADPSYALEGDRPHAVDEWQRVPAIWDVVRHAVDDAGKQRGNWILTGSSTPRLQETSHSGAGRIGRIRMRTMSLQESGDSSGRVSLSRLFDGDFSPVQCGSSISRLAELACRGGWPGAIDFASEDARMVAADYLEALYAQTVPRMGGNGEIARRLVAALARNLGQSATLSTLASDVYARDKDKATPTDWEERQVSAHLDILRRAYIVEEIPGWVPASRSPLRMRTKPKRYLADPSLAVATLGMSAKALLNDWQTFGLVFENLCIRDLAVYAQALPFASPNNLKYYRDDSNLEVDAVIEQTDGRWAGLEVKVSMEKVDAAAKHLVRFSEKVAKPAAARVAPPSFLAVVVGVGEAAYRRPDGVYVIPITALGR